MATTPIVPAAPETVQPVVTTATSEPSAQQAARDAVQQKYSALYEPAPQEPVATTEPAVAEPAVAAAEPDKPAEPTREEILAQALTTVVDRLAALEARTAPAPAPEPAVPATAEKAPIDYLKAGDFDGFEKALTARIQAAMQPQVTQQSTEEAIARVRAEGEVSKFIDTIKSQNPDLEPMNGWVVAEAQALIQAAAPKIKNLNDYVAVYKDSVTKAVETVRKAAQIIRGSGKLEAMTTRKEVVASGVISPASPSTDKQKEPAPEPESNVDYLTRRQNRHNEGRGLFYP